MNALWDNPCPSFCKRAQPILRTTAARTMPSSASQGFLRTALAALLGGHCKSSYAHVPNLVATTHLTHPPQDRGYHALRASSDHNARVLHRLLHTWETELSKSCSPIFAAAAENVGKVSQLPAPASVPQDADMDAVDEQALAAEAAAIDKEAAAWAGVVATAVASASSRAATLHRVSVSPDASKSGAATSVTRVDALCSRLGAVLGDSLTTGKKQRTAGSADLEDVASAVVSRAAALRADAKATKPMKKKALTDLLRGLNDRGVSLRRSAVPADEREPVQWFLTHADVELPASLGASDDVMATWAAAEGSYFRNMARIKALWQINDGLFHGDISTREADAAKHSVEHLLHVQRTQRGISRDFVTAAREVAQAADLCSALAATEDALPCASFTRAWMWRARGCLEDAQRTACDVVVLLKALRCVETSPHHVGCVPSALKAAQAASTALQGAQAALERHLCSEGILFPDEHRSPVLITSQMASDLLVALHTGPAQLEALRTAVPDAGDLPGWQDLCDAIASVAALHGAYVSEVPDTGAAQRAAVSGAVAAADGVVQDVLLFAQHMQKANTVAAPENAADADNDGDSGSVVNLVAQTKALAAMMAPERLRRIAAGVHSLAHEVAAMTTPSSYDTHGVRAAAASLAALAPMLQLVLRASVHVAGDFVALHRATTKLCGLLTSVFAGLARDGYCTPAEQREAGADDAGNGKLLDDQAGTGIGEGEGKKDISKEIEDEAQILGMEDLKKDDTAPPPPPPGTEDKGIEMAGDFEGDMHELEHDAEKSDDDGEPETEADQLDKEVRARRVHSAASLLSAQCSAHRVR